MMVASADFFSHTTVHILLFTSFCMLCELIWVLWVVVNFCDLLWISLAVSWRLLCSYWVFLTNVQAIDPENSYIFPYFIITILTLFTKKTVPADMPDNSYKSSPQGSKKYVLTFTYIKIDVGIKDTLTLIIMPKLV